MLLRCTNAGKKGSYFSMKTNFILIIHTKVVQLGYDGQLFCLFHCLCAPGYIQFKEQVGNMCFDGAQG